MNSKQRKSDTEVVQSSSAGAAWRLGSERFARRRSHGAYNVIRRHRASIRQVTLVYIILTVDTGARWVRDASLTGRCTRGAGASLHVHGNPSECSDNAAKHDRSGGIFVGTEAKTMQPSRHLATCGHLRATSMHFGCTQCSLAPSGIGFAPVTTCFNA